MHCCILFCFVFSGTRSLWIPSLPKTCYVAQADCEVSESSCCNFPSTRIIGLNPHTQFYFIFFLLLATLGMRQTQRKKLRPRGIEWFPRDTKGRRALKFKPITSGSNSFLYTAGLWLLQRAIWVFEIMWLKKKLQFLKTRLQKKY
jgi:hypothetical protein